eukprot:3164633-Pyramimonas_sp.AAC.1
MGSDRPLSDSVDQHYQGLVQDKTKSPNTPGLKEGIHPKHGHTHTHTHTTLPSAVPPAARRRSMQPAKCAPPLGLDTDTVKWTVKTL